MSVRPIGSWRCAIGAAALLAAALTGCQFPWPPPEPADTRLRPEPLPIQQAQAYPETVTGLFMSLVDFESLPGSPAGHEQVGFFSFSPQQPGDYRRFVVNVTRTGAGAMEAALSPGGELVFTIPYLHDLTGYTLLTFALYSQTLRDDLLVTLQTSSASWTSHRTLVRPGWNYVLTDIQRLADAPGFDIKKVKTMRLGFCDAAQTVRFNLDDIMLVNNQRRVQPAPVGMSLTKTGLNYELSGAHLQPPVSITQGADGLWRLGAYQPVVQVLRPDQPPAGAGEDLDLLGSRRVGQVEITEAGPLRLGIVNTCYFPRQSGEWVSLAIRQIRWEHTLYADGRWATHVELNNAGGEQIGGLRITFPTPVAIIGAGIEKELLAQHLPGPIGRWSFLRAPDTDDGRIMLRNYLVPAGVRLALGDADAWADGDSDHDRFDESQGCYFLAADRGGNCRFTITPGPDGLVSPIFRVAGNWTGKVHVASEGLRIEGVSRLADGSVLFVLPGRIASPTAVEVAGKAADLPR